MDVHHSHGNSLVIGVKMIIMTLSMGTATLTPHMSRILRTGDIQPARVEIVQGPAVERGPPYYLTGTPVGRDEAQAAALSLPVAPQGKININMRAIILDRNHTTPNGDVALVAEAALLTIRMGMGKKTFTRMMGMVIPVVRENEISRECLIITH
jgi:hypothetical protein